MTAKTMAEVLAEHQFMHHSFNGVTQKRYLACSCGESPLAGDHPTHLAAALSAAGYGLVADAKREALEEAADVAHDKTVGMDGSAIRVAENRGFMQRHNVSAAARWLRRRAAEMRQRDAES